jgi:hypothetical protein
MEFVVHSAKSTVRFGGSWQDGNEVIGSGRKARKIPLLGKLIGFLPRGYSRVLGGVSAKASYFCTH